MLVIKFEVICVEVPNAIDIGNSLKVLFSFAKSIFWIIEPGRFRESPQNLDDHIAQEQYVSEFYIKHMLWKNLEIKGRQNEGDSLGGLVQRLDILYPILSLEFLGIVYTNN